MAGEVDDDEQQIADFALELLGVAVSKLGLDLAGFFANFIDHGLRAVPVEADLAGLLLQLQSPRERRQAGRDAGERAGAARGRALARSCARAAFSCALI